MAKKISHEDLFDGDVFKPTAEGAKRLLKVTEELQKGLIDSAKEIKKAFGDIKIESSADLKKFSELVKESAKVQKAKSQIDKESVKIQAEVEKFNQQAAKTQREKIKNEKELNKTKQESVKLDKEVVKQINEETKAEITLQKVEQEKLKTEREIQKNQQAQLKTKKDTVNLIAAEEKELRRAAKEIENVSKASKKQADEQKKLNSVYEQNKRQLKAVSDRYKELVSRGREGTATGKLLKVEFDRLDKSVRKAEQAVGQFNRNVGNYKQALTEAIQDTGLFSGKLGQMISTLRQVRDAQDKTAKGAKALGNAFKLTGIGLVLAALAALKSAFDAAEEFTAGVAEQVEIFNAGLKGFTLGLNEGRVAFIAYTEQLIAYRKEVILLQEALQQVTLDQADFADIANDTTIGFKERNAALQESIRLGDLKATKEVELAQKALNLVDAEIAAIQKANGGREVEITFLQKRSEAQLALNEAVDRQSDLVRENAQQQRQFVTEQASAAIDLLLKQKQNANARKIILEKEIADEKVQLERRKQAALELAQVNTKTTNEEIRIFKESFKVKFDSNKLVNEQDAIKLKAQIESIQFLDENNKLVGLGVEAQKLLAEIVAKYQKENIEFLEAKKKLQEEEIKRTLRIAEINAEIALLQQADNVKALEDAYNTLNDALDENLQKQLENENVFDTKLQKQRKLQLDIRKQQAEELYNSQIELLEQQAELERQNVIDTVSDEKIRAAEIKKINAQLAIDLGNLNAQQQADEIQRQKKDIEDEKAIAKKKLEIALDYGNRALDIAEQAFQKQSEKRQAFLDKEIQDRESNIERQRSLAERGLANTLAFEEAAKAKAELAREQEKKKEERRQKTIAFLRLLSGYAEQDPNTAIVRAIADIALADLVAGAFATGVEGLNGKGTGTSDSNVALLSKGESVITAKATKENAGLATAMNKGAVEDYFVAHFLNQGSSVTKSTASNMDSSAMLHQLMGVNNRLENLEEAIRSKREQSVQWDTHSNMIIREQENGIRRTIKYIRQKPRL